ncbi:MAG: hypothetical protein LBF34_03930 [Puniceicoccales bacterium]|jgi:hypothetical protein|nr:hypothetical protein [Puniceicoccales bacterium]
MFGNKNIIVGSVFLTFGLLGDHIYGAESAVFVDVSDASEKISQEEDLWDYIENAEGLDGVVGIAKRIRSGADFTSKREGGKTLLYRSCCPEVFATLLCLPGIDVNDQDDEGNTILHYMILCFIDCLNSSCIGFQEEIEMLLACGANPCLKNTDGKVACQFLEEWRDEERGLPIKDKSADSETLLEGCEKAIQILRTAEAKWTETHAQQAVE